MFSAEVPRCTRVERSESQIPPAGLQSRDKTAAIDRFRMVRRTRNLRIDGRQARLAPRVLETNTVLNEDRIANVAEKLANCLEELDRLGADVAAAHVDSALQALRRQFDVQARASKAE